MPDPDPAFSAYLQQYLRETELHVYDVVTVAARRLGAGNGHRVREVVNDLLGGYVLGTRSVKITEPHARKLAAVLDAMQLDGESSVRERVRTELCRVRPGLSHLLD